MCVVCVLVLFALCLMYGSMSFCFLCAIWLFIVHAVFVCLTILCCVVYTCFLCCVVVFLLVGPVFVFFVCYAA